MTRREGGGRQPRRGEKASSLCSSASERRLHYITVSGLGSSHAFKEEAHVPLHLKSRGRAGEDEDWVEAPEEKQRQREEKKKKGGQR